MPTLPDNPLELFTVRGRSALIAGATGAFGEVAAETLVRAGANVVLAAGTADRLGELERRLAGLGGRVEALALRPDGEQNCAALVDAAVSHFGGLDILVVASGINDVAPIEDLTPERWQAVMDANVRGPWLLCRAAGRQLRQQGRGGKVVLVSSARGLLGHPAGYTAYCPSKSAVDGMIRALGCEWGRYRINVNAIAPTVFRSPLTAWMFGDDERARSTRDAFLQRIPIGRLGEPADLAGALLYLCSAASDFMTGQVLRPDGGYTAG